MSSSTSTYRREERGMSIYHYHLSSLLFQLMYHRSHQVQISCYCMVCYDTVVRHSGGQSNVALIGHLICPACPTIPLRVWAEVKMGADII